MPGRSTDKDILEVPTTRPETRQGSEANPKSLEFRAEVIPYDNCEDHNAPILAFSGDNMHIIFNIPKDRFLKLGVAAINHLGYDSDFKPPENTSNSIEESDNTKLNEISKSGLNDVHSLDGDNASEIVTTNEDGNEALKNKDGILPIDIKSCGDDGNGPVELDKSQSGIEAEKSHLETKSLKDSDNFKALADSDKSLPVVEKYGEGSEIMESSNRSYEQCESNDFEKDSEKKNYEDTEEKFEESKSNDVERVYVEQNCETESEADIEGDMNLSAHSLDISAEDCPELENAWPDIYPYEKTEEIPVTELKSLELKGLSTKFFKLELSNEFIVIKVTSGSNVLVDAAKYKELEAEFISKTGSSEDLSVKKPTESFTSDFCIKSLPVNLKHADSVDEKIKTDKNVPCESKDESVVSEGATGTLASELIDKSKVMASESVVPVNVTVSKEPIQTETVSKNSYVDETKNAGTSNSFELDSKVEDVQSSNVASIAEKSRSADEKFELETGNCSGIVLGNSEFEKIITLKIEEKLEELDANIPGDSPTERLRFTLNDSLKSPCGNIEAKKMEMCASTEILSKESRTKVSLFEKSNGRISVSSEKCSKMISKDEFASECLDSCISNISYENNSESLNVSSNTEKLAESDSEHASSDENIVASLDRSETRLVDGDVFAAEKLVSNDQVSNDQNESFSNANVSLENINIGKVSMNLPSGDTEDSFENSALGNDLHVSEVETLKNFSQSENIECNETNSQKNLNVPCKSKENETLNDVGATSLSKHSDELPSEPSKQVAIKENDSRKKSIVDSTKGKVSDDLEKYITVKNTPQGTSINGVSVETFKNELKAETNASGQNFSEVKDVDEVHENLEKEHTGSEFVKEISDVSLSSSAEETPEMSQSKDSEIVSSDEEKDVKNGKAETKNSELIANEVILDEPHSLEHVTNGSSYKHPTDKPLVEQNSECTDLSETTVDTEGKLPENSFTSNVDSFMDTTVDTNIESASDFESDDVKSIASESDDGKDSSKFASKRKGVHQENIREADEVDCAPTRVRTKKAVYGLSKDTIPEHLEVKNGKASKAHGSNLNISKKSPLAIRSLRSKSVDPTPQTKKGIQHERKHAVAESEEIRRTRDKTPDIVNIKDIKTTARSSPRKFTRAASAEPSSASKVENAKTTAADHSKSQVKLDSSVSTRRVKRK